MMRRKRIRPTRWFFLLCLVLTGCASSTDPTELYLLEASHVSPAGANDTQSTQPTLVVEPVTVAPFLDSAGIVYQTNDNRVVVARNNQWAAPLTGQLTDGLYATLTSDMPDANVLTANTQVSGLAYRLTTQVDRFQGHYSGVAVIAGTWQLFNPNNKRIAQQRFEIEVPLRTDGYPELVRSLSRGWREISQSLVEPVSHALGSARNSL